MQARSRPIRRLAVLVGRHEDDRQAARAVGQARHEIAPQRVRVKVYFLGAHARCADPDVEPAVCEDVAHDARHGLERAALISEKAVHGVVRYLDVEDAPAVSGGREADPRVPAATRELAIELIGLDGSGRTLRAR